MAMQNDPSKSPTTFQQLQPRQALAQKEQQLGVMGALMATTKTLETVVLLRSPCLKICFAMDGGL